MRTGDWRKLQLLHLKWMWKDPDRHFREFALSPEGERALTELCAKGCESSVLEGLLFRLARASPRDLERQRRTRSTPTESIPGKDPMGLDPFYRDLMAETASGAIPSQPASSVPTRDYTQSGLEITGGFDVVPEIDSRERTIPASVETPPVAGAIQGSIVERRRGRGFSRSLKGRALKSLIHQLDRAVADMRRIADTSLGRRGVGTDGSVVLALNLSERLRAYTARVVAHLGLGQEPSRPQLEQVDEKGDSESRRGRAVRIDPRPLDSLDSALGTLAVRDLKLIQNRLRKLAHRLQHLHATTTGHEIEWQFPTFIDVPKQLEAYATRVLSAMIAIPVGPKRRPDTSRLLWRLFDYVHAQTGSCHDQQIAQILEDIGFPLGPADSIDAVALQTWRHQHPRSSARL